MPGTSPGMTIETMDARHRPCYLRRGRAVVSLAFQRAWGLPHSRHRNAPELRASGTADAQRIRSLACKIKSTRAQSPRTRRKHPAFRTQWLYGLLRALPGGRACSPPFWTVRVFHAMMATDPPVPFDVSIATPGPHDLGRPHTTPPSYRILFTSRIERRARPPHPAPRLLQKTPDRSGVFYAA